MEPKRQRQTRTRGGKKRSKKKPRKQQLLRDITTGLLGAAEALFIEVRENIYRLDPDYPPTRWAPGRRRALKNALKEHADAMHWLDTAVQHQDNGDFSAAELAQAMCDRNRGEHGSLKDTDHPTNLALQLMSRLLNDHTAREVIATHDPTGDLLRQFSVAGRQQGRPSNLTDREDLMCDLLAHLGIVVGEEGT